MICDNCLNRKYCLKGEPEDRPIKEFDDGTVWCYQKLTQEQIDASEELYNSMKELIK